jgi:hypothetical protein
MDTGTIIAIVVGCVSLAALGFVAWQTMLTRKSVQMAHRTTEISDLPKADAVIHVQYYLNKWKTELEQIIKDEKYIKAQVLTEDTTLGEKHGLTTPKGLITKPVYEYLPPWLQIICISAAQYYYDCKSHASLLSDDTFNTEAKLRLLSYIVDLARANASRIKGMLSYIEKMIPEWYLNCPASIQDDQFMDR